MATFEQYEKKDKTKAWKFQAYLGINEVTGKPVKTTRRNFKTKKEAQLALSRLKLEFENKETKKIVTETYQEIYDLWFSSYKKTVKETTSLATERYMKLHVLPILGTSKIDLITPKTCQNAVNQWSDKLQVYKVVLQYASKVMDYAITLELIEKNPFDRVVRPKIKRTRKEKEIKFYTTNQVRQVLLYLEKKAQSVKDENLLYKYFAEWDLCMYRILAFTGLRAGEALALTFDDIDFFKKKLTVNKNLSKVKNGYTVSSPKTKTSKRTISLDNKTCKVLKHWQLRQKEFYFQNNIKNKGIVFADYEGNYSNRQALYMRSNRIADFTNLPRIGTHGWRHTHASMLYEAGVPMKKTQIRLGHANLEITNSIYTHLSEKQKNETAKKLASFANF